MFLALEDETWWEWWCWGQSKIEEGDDCLVLKENISLWEWLLLSAVCFSQALQDLSLLSCILIVLTLFQPSVCSVHPQEPPRLRWLLSKTANSRSAHWWVCVCPFLSNTYLSTSSGTASSHHPVLIHDTNHCISLYSLSHQKTGKCRYAIIKKGSLVGAAKTKGFNFAFISEYACKHQICLF